MRLSDCGDCPKKSTCLIPNENKTWCHTKPIRDTELEIAVEILEAFNRAGISYRVNEDGSFNFHSITDLERASEISQEIQRRY